MAMDRSDIGTTAKTRTEWIEVVTPPDLDPITLRNKEKAFVDYACAEVAAGRKFWGYFK